MKIQLLLACGISLISTLLHADEYDSDARAYQAYIMTFEWPKEDTTEYIEYKNILSLNGIPKFTKQDESPTSSGNGSNAADIETINNPFDSYRKKIQRGVKVLTNHSWTLIFDRKGDTLSRTINSPPQETGYSELSGTINITLGRYLETDINLSHYQFAATAISTQSFNNSSKVDQIETQNQAKPLPSARLDITQANKTASKKLNYLDHPLIGTLLYFEPMELEDAIQQQALENLMSNIKKIGETNR